jgi:hypothetical protein
MKAYKLIVSAVAATVLCGALTTSATARNLSLSNQTWRFQFRELALRLPFFTTRCQMTLEGSFHSRTFAKVQGSLVGYITTARLGPCSAGSKTILTETLPWHVRYLAFSGPLPNITDLVFNIVGWSQRVREPFGINCLYRSTAEEPVIITAFRDGSGAFTATEMDGDIRTGEECFREVAELTSDRGTATVAGTTATRITVRLI